jgi:hypothetical protein
MNDAWETDDSEVDFDEAEPLLSIEDGLKKGFLEKLPGRKSREPTPQR